MTETSTVLNTAQIAVPGTDAKLEAALVDGKPFAALKPMCDALGINTWSQQRKLAGKSWATTVIMTAVAADGKPREMFMIDRRTLTMWLATIEEARVTEKIRPTIQAFQHEAANALDAYFNEGGAINPAATEEQLDRLTQRARGQMELIQLAKGIIDDNHLETKARLVLARGLGEAPEIEPESMPLYAQTYLEGRGVGRDRLRRIAGPFGKKVKAAYVLEHGKEPGRYPISSGNGQVRMAYAYVEADRPLLDAIFDEFYAEEAVA